MAQILSQLRLDPLAPPFAFRIGPRSEAQQVRPNPRIPGLREAGRKASAGSLVFAPFQVLLPAGAPGTLTFPGPSCCLLAHVGTGRALLGARGDPRVGSVSPRGPCTTIPSALSSFNRADGVPTRGRRLLAKPPPVPVSHLFPAPVDPGLVLGPDSLPLQPRRTEARSGWASGPRLQVVSASECLRAPASARSVSCLTVYSSLSFPREAGAGESHLQRRHLGHTAGTCWHRAPSRTVWPKHVGLSLRQCS